MKSASIMLIASLVSFGARAGPHDGNLRAPHATVEQLIRSTGIPGLAVTVIVRGSVLWSQGYGFADLENRVPVTPHTSMRIGSISKSLTGAAIARLTAAGKIDLDGSVRKYLPSLPIRDQGITLRELGGHIGGVRTYLTPSEKTVYQHYDTVQDALKLFAADPLASAPGTRFLYSSYSFVLLSAAAEQAANLSYVDLLNHYLLEPLGRHGTFPDDVRRIIPGRAKQYEKDASGQLINAPYCDDSYKVAASGMLSTSDDLAVIGNALIGDKFLDTASRALLFTSQTLASGERTGYGFGWFVDMDKFLDDHRGEIPVAQYLHLKEISKGRKLVWHSGTANGATAMLLLTPSTKVVVAMISNLGSIEPQLIASAMEVEAALSRSHESAIAR